jgi:hypothetical protein
MALIPQMTVPTGSGDFTNDEVLPGANWIYDWEITEFISTAGSSQINRTLDEVTADTYLEFAQSWTIAYSLADRLGAYTEWFALIPSGADTAKSQHFFNRGFTYLVTDDIQFDIRAGVGLNAPKTSRCTVAHLFPTDCGTYTLPTGYGEHAICLIVTARYDSLR